MADAWYCLIAGAQIGPISVAELKVLAAEGRLSPQDQVRRGSSGPWALAGQVKGLFPAGGASLGAPSSPQGSDEPPVHPRQRPILRAKPVESNGVDGSRKEPSPSTGAGRPPIPAPASQTAPPRHPAPSAPGPEEGLAFLEQEYVSPPTTILTQTARPDPFSRMKNPKVLLWILLGLLGLLALLIVVLFIINREGPRLREDRAAEESHQRAANEERPEKKPAASEATPNKPKPAKPQAPAPIQWIDASRDAWVGSNVTVRVLAAEIGYPKVLSTSGQTLISNEPYLALRLQLINRATSASVKYAGWAGPDSGAKLTDQSGRECLWQMFGAGTLVEGQQKATSIGPQASIQDVLVFAKPADDATTLRLSLPGGALGDEQSPHFEIPKAMITPLPPPAATQPKAEPAKGPLPRPPAPRPGDGVRGPTGDPARDFGIEGVEQPPVPDAKPPAEKPPSTP